MLSVGRYQLIETLGEGGMGVVYKAFDPLIQRTVAVKLISARLDDSPDLRDRFFAEARAAGQLSHRNIVTIFDLGEEDGHPYFAMEFLEGRNLRVRMQSPEQMSLDRKLEVMAQVCEGLAYAHAKGITHRDIKPANIFITDAGHVKVLDFGLARLPASELTHSKTLIGTLNYMAPEQISGEKTDLRTDVFAVGVVFYELLSSRSPFEADSVASLLNKILHELPQPLGKLQSGIHAQLSAIVERALAKAREERYQSLGDLLIDLAECRAQIRGTDPGSGSRPLGPPGPGWSSGWTPGTPPPSRPDWGPGRRSTDSAAAVAGRSVSGEGSGRAGTPPPSTPPGGAAAGSAAAPPRRRLADMEPTREPARFMRPLVLASLLATSLLVGVALFATGTWPAWRRVSEGDRTSGAVTAARTARGASVSPERAGRPGEGTRPDLPAAPPAAPNVSPPAGAPPPPVEGTTGRNRQAPPPGRGSAATAGRAVRPDAGRTEAEAASAALRAAKANADAVSASELAPAPYHAASEAQASGVQLMGRRDFSLAAVKLYEASGLFRRAEMEARTEQVRRTDQARISEQARRGEQDRVSQAERPTAPPEVRPVPSEPAPGSGTPPSVPPVPPRSDPGPPNAPAPPASAETGVHELLARYVAALEARDLASLKRIWPGLSGSQEAAIRSEFENARSIDVSLVQPSIEVSGNGATVTCHRRYELETLDGHRLRSNTTSTLALRRSGAAWVIESVRHDVVR